MKKNSKYIVLTAAIALCAGSSLPFLAGSSTLNPERDSVKSEVPYCVTSPSVPDKITFAGQAIDLLRYDHRERMDRELMSFTYMHSTTMLMVKRANRYFPVIEPILKANGLPDDFKYLAVIESNLNPLAKSPAGAAGLWQFMSATGREFGLEVNSNIDERYHIEKETKAACKYLKDAYQKYGNWLCVAAAYNAGQGRISTQLQKQMVDQAVDLWLVEETSRYMFRLLAAKAVISNPQQYGFLLKREHLYPPIPYTEVTVTTGIGNLAQFAKDKGITYAQLKDANPWLRDTSLMNKSGRTYILKIPTQAGMHYTPRKQCPTIRIGSSINKKEREDTMMMLNFDFVLRLLVAGILGAIIGLDREYRAKEAGYRTHFLVSLGSALIMIVSQYGFQEIIKESSVTLDPSRVAAQVVSGIGFIGAGTIIFQKQIVRGLTTAAGIWATAGIGLAVGAGMYTISIAATLLTLAGLELLSLIFKSIGMKSSVITFSTSSKEILPQVSRRFNSKDYLVVSYNLDRQVQGEYTNYQVTMVIKSKKSYDEGYLLQLMQEFPEVTVEKIE